MTRAQVELALRFVKMAEARPIDNVRRRQFAEARTQAALKVSPLEANAIVDAAYREHKDNEPIPVPASADEAEGGNVAADRAALKEEVAVLGQELAEAIKQSLERGEEIERLRTELERLKTPVVDNNPAEA